MLYITRTADVQASINGRTLFGIVAPFGQYATVYDGAGPSRPYEERIARGAFARSINERGSKINLIYDHDNSAMPIGKATLLREQDDGLFAEFQIARTARGDEALQLVHEGMISGFSIRAGIVRSNKDSRSQVTRQELALRDVSLTEHPVYATAGVTGIRSTSAVRPTGRPFERLRALTGSEPDPEPLSAELAARLLSLRLKVTP